MSANSRLAEVYRACVRDTKASIRQRRGRQVPVGVAVPDIATLRLQQLQYFTAGPTASRVDFFALENWSWAGKSSIKISGWEHLVRTFESVPVPMFLAAYGTNIVRPRMWQEVECLYSPDMTGVFSGGCAYTFFEDGSRYGVVKILDEDGRVERGRDFSSLRKRMRAVNARSAEQVFGRSEVRDYESWVGEFPETAEDRWNATSVLPAFPGVWDEVVAGICGKPEAEGAPALGSDLGRLPFRPK